MRIKEFKQLYSDDIDDFPPKVQEAMLKLGIAVIFFRIGLIFFSILLVALMLWFNKITIFLLTIQFILCIALFRTQLLFKEKALKLLEKL